MQAGLKPAPTLGISFKNEHNPNHHSTGIRVSPCFL